MLILDKHLVGRGQLTAKQLEIDRLRREVAKLKVERDMPKSRDLLREGVDVKLGFSANTRDLAKVVAFARLCQSRVGGSMPG